MTSIGAISLGTGQFPDVRARTRQGRPATIFSLAAFVVIFRERKSNFLLYELVHNVFSG